jgi:hypothetical protein
VLRCAVQLAGPGGVPLPYVDNTHLPCIDWSRAADGGATAAFSEYQFNDQQYRQVAVVSLSAGDVYRLRLVFEATMPGLCGFGASTPFDFHAKAVNV